MADTHDGSAGASPEAQPVLSEAHPAAAKGGSLDVAVGEGTRQERQVVSERSTHADKSTIPTGAKKRAHPWRSLLLLAGTVAALGFSGFHLAPIVRTMLDTVSTEDAYVNGHVTFVAPRVAGQVSRVLVDDNFRVKKGDLLVQLDKEPFEVQVAIKKAAVEASGADLVAAQAQVRGFVAQARSYRFQLQHAIEDVDE